MKPSNTSTEDRMMRRLQSANGASGTESTNTDQEGRPFIPPPPPPPTQTSNSSSQRSGRASESGSASTEVSGRSNDMGNVSTQTSGRATVNVANTQYQYSQPPAPRVTVLLQPYNGLTSPLQWWMTFMSYVSLYSLTDRQALDIFPFNTTELVRHWFLTLGDQFKTNLNVFKEAFFKRFREDSCESDLDIVKQEDQKSVDNFIHRFQFAACDLDLSEKHLVSRAIKISNQRFVAKSLF